MNIADLIEKKRLGQAHSEDELAYIVNGYVEGDIDDSEMTLWLKAVCLEGMTLDETAWLTDLYVQSGRVLDFSDAGGVVVDKHSTGGVGDKTTLALMPMLAACGLKVAKLSGRGLGFTGGTIDKLEAIPNFKCEMSAEAFANQVKTLGFALGSQSADLAPADGKIYALRDVTGTVASIPLIAASVVSKKIAAGAEVITLDIKVGSGAFMKSMTDAKALAETCREVGARLGRKISTVISSMEQPLGFAIGHTVEMIESIDTLKGKGPRDLTDLCLKLGSVTLLDAGCAKTLEDATTQLEEVIQNGKALEVFRKLIASQHGNANVVDDYLLMPQPAQKIDVLSTKSGVIQTCDALSIAKAAKVLGAGRVTKSASIDLAVGVVMHKKIGDAVQQGEPLATLWVNQQGIEESKNLVLEAYLVDTKPITPPPLVEEIIVASAQVLQ